MENLISLKRTLSDEELNTNIWELPIEDVVKLILLDNNIRTLKDLISKDEHFIKTILPIDYYKLKDYIHCIGANFKDEFKNLNISDEYALIPIDKLNLDNRVKKIMRANNIKVLGELLKLTPEDLITIKSFGNGCLKNILDCLSKLNLTLPKSSDFFSIIKNELKENGETLLEDVFSSSIVKILYDNGLYTVNSLMEYGSRVSKIKGFGPMKYKTLINEMTEKDLKFKDTEENIQNGIIITREKLNRISLENDYIKEKIREKEELISEYNSLISKREILLKRERELDDLIAKKIEEMAKLQERSKNGTK